MFVFLVAGLQHTLAQQGATSCSAIAAGLGTTEIAPVTGIIMITRSTKLNCVLANVHV